MSNLISRLFISTVAEDSHEMAREFGLGIELAEFCTAYNMDECFSQHDARARELMDGISARVFHGPYNELCPAAIDPIVREHTAKRYRQSIALAQTYGIRKIVIHTGYIPFVYFPEWFIPESVKFWRSFLADLQEDIVICLENVMEAGPEIQYEIVSAVNDPRLKACLDVGHANTCLSHTPVEDWIRMLRPFLSHVHVHNNDGITDLHRSLGDGVLDMERIIDQLERETPEVTYTIESMVSRPSIDWLCQRQYI